MTKKPNAAKTGSRKGKGNIKPEKKAEMVALLPELGTQTAVAEVFGVSRPVVTRALTDPEVLPLVRIKKEEIAQGFASLTKKLLKRYEDLADGATLTDKGVVLLGICADKALLYAGEPTSITENRSDAALREKAEALLSELLPEYAGNRQAAVQALRESAPTLGRLVM